MAIKYIFTVLGDLAGNALKYVRCKSDEKQLEFSDCSLQKTSIKKANVQSIPDKTDTIITFSLEEIDDGNWHSTSSNTSRITVTDAGDYQVSAQVGMISKKDSQYEIRILKSGTKIYNALFISAKDGLCISLGLPARAITLAANDYLEIQVYHNSNEATNVENGTETFFSVVKIS